MTHVNQGKNRKKGNLQSKDDGEGEGEGEGKRGSEKKKRSIMRKNHNINCVRRHRALCQTEF